jgi:putative transposase
MKATGRARTSVLARASREAWTFRTVKSGRRGKPAKEYLVADLADDVRTGLAAHWARENVLSLKESTKEQRALRAAEMIPAPSSRSLSAPTQAGALARADLVKHYTEALAKAKRGKKAAARERFAKAYNTGLLFPEIFKIIGPASWKSIETWKRKLRDGDAFDLADMRGAHRKGQCSLADDQAKVLLACALHPNRPLISEAIRLARTVCDQRQMPLNGISDATLRRFINDWKSRHYDQWVFYREGIKGWNDKVAPYVERDYDRLEVGDVLVADGHTLNFEIVNPWTGRPKRMTLILWLDMKSYYPLGWEIMPTENISAIASALRRAILRLGKTPRVVYLDNGKAFGARFFEGTDLSQAGFEGLFARLGVEGVIHAWPYHAQSKTVERFFRDFAELERALPSYVGTSIDKKPPRLNRGEKLHRKLYDKLGGPPTVEQAHLAIAAFFDEHSSRPMKRLEGRTPAQLFAAGRGPGVDPDRLAYLMMAAEVKTIHRNGIRMFGRNYYDPALYGRRHQVTVRYDLQDQSHVLVYAPDGEFICRAEPPIRVHPAAQVLGDDTDRAELKRQLELKRGLERTTTGSAREFAEAEIAPVVREQQALAGLDRARSESRALPAQPTMTEAEAAEIEAKAAEISRRTRAAGAEFGELSEDGLRYVKLSLASRNGAALHDDDRTFMRFYRQSEEYNAKRAIIDERLVEIMEEA